jgi:phosphoglucosamine mutase
MVMEETGKKMSELAAVMDKYPQILRNVRVSNERKSYYLTSTEIMGAIKELESRLDGRVLVRPSGTEPLIRIMLEGRDLEEITHEAEVLAALVEDVLS